MFMLTYILYDTILYGIMPTMVPTAVKTTNDCLRCELLQLCIQPDVSFDSSKPQQQQQ